MSVFKGPAKASHAAFQIGVVASMQACAVDGGRRLIML